MIYAIGVESKRHAIYTKGAPLGTEDFRLVEADADGWIPCHGVECPLPSDTRCDTKATYSSIAVENRDPEILNWLIVGLYRPILNTEPSEPESAEWAVGERCVWQLADVCMGEHVILAKDGDTYWIRDDHGGYDMADREELRPIRTDEDKAVEEMIRSAGLDDEEYNRGVCRDLYRAGYRKMESAS